MSELKVFAGDKINVAQKLKFVLGRVENIVGKGENAGYKITNYINTRNIFWKCDFEDQDQTAHNVLSDPGSPSSPPIHLINMACLKKYKKKYW